MTSDLWQKIRKRSVVAKPPRIVLAEGEDARVLEAAVAARAQGLAEPILIGDRAEISKRLSASPAGTIATVDPSQLSVQERDAYLRALSALPKYKSLTSDELKSKLDDPLTFGCLYVKLGHGDGFIGGARRTTADTLRAVFSVLGLSRSAPTLFGMFLIEPRVSQNSPLVLLADCAVIPEPSAKQLAAIATGAAEAYQFFTGEKARVAFLSFSTLGSADHPSVEKVRQARDMARAKAPGIEIEGEWQADAALDIFTAGIKGVHSPMAGRANVLVVPDLNCGNIAYKLVQRLGGCRAVGPVLWGTGAPANDLSRGCTTEDIVDMIALTSLQAQHVDQTVSSTHS